MITSRFRLRRPGLVAEVLAVQLAITAAIGLAALISFAVITRTVIEDNLVRWASSWAEQVQEFGAPLYVGDRAAALVDLDRFIASYPEVRQVTLFAPDGSEIVAIDNGGNVEPMPPLDLSRIASLETLASQSPPGILTEALGDRRFVLHGPVIVESLAGEDLLNFDPDSAKSSSELRGFVSLELDFADYLSALPPRLATGGAIIAVLIVAGWAGSRMLIKRALEPLSALQVPLQQLGLGEMDVELPRPRHRELATIVSVLRETIDALRQREQHLIHLASRDALTGLYNRHRMMQELADEVESCSDSNRSSALFFIDLDQFKYVNDTSGHVAGDNLLVSAARQIRACVRKHDIVARFGGDEFLVLVRDVSRHEAKKIAAHVLESMRDVAHAEDDRVFHLQCSIGIAIIGSSRHRPEEIITHGDLACQAAKQRGRNRVEIYRISSKQGQQMEKDVQWMRQIRKSLNDDSFELHFQPLMHVATGVIDHYEALLRIKTDDGLIAPSTFLPAAARFGQMSAVDFWVIEEAIRSLAELRAHDDSDLKLSINISGYALEESNLASRIKSLLHDYNVPGDRLVIELTEHLAVRFACDTEKRLDQIRALGCALAIDDFGTGYSSFAYLKRLPVDYLKIDGAFIRNVANDRIDQCMVRMVAELAREARLCTVAEYVENAGTLNLIRKYGIDYAQGHYVGEAVQALPALLEERNTA